jgi:hypothetical protein
LQGTGLGFVESHGVKSSSERVQIV